MSGWDSTCQPYIESATALSDTMTVLTHNCNPYIVAVRADIKLLTMQELQLLIGLKYSYCFFY